jgi:hypothetical protein
MDSSVISPRTDGQRVHAAVTLRVIPTLAVRAKTAADALDISLGSFLVLVKEGKMPKPTSIPGHPGLVLYDFEAVREAWEALKYWAGRDDTNEWDET